MNSAVDIFLSKAKSWQTEMLLLRKILLASRLEESLKWGKPCYSYNQKNIAIIQPFKSHCDLGFFKGALLKDEQKLLGKAGEHTQDSRQLRFKNTQEIVALKECIQLYIKEAISIEQKGIIKGVDNKVEKIHVQELEDAFKKNTEFKNAFYKLTPGRQRAYLIYFSGAKHSETRISRINNYTRKIICGKGLNDCTCGLSKRMPLCDGSHKFLNTIS